MQRTPITAFKIPSDSHKDQGKQSFWGLAIFFILLHIPLVFLLKLSPIISTAHALLTLGVGIYFLMCDQMPDRVIYVIAYIAGAELLWRGLGASVFWEFAKYATILLLVLGLLKYQLLAKAVKWPVFYFVLLIPSIFVLPSFDRQAISFNLAGPFALALASMFFSTQVITVHHLRRIFVSILAPSVGLGILSIYGIFSAQVIYFFQGSNFATSADIGPNQVSALLGLGALSAFAGSLIVGKQLGVVRLLWIGISLWLLAQSALTFSRGGFWNALIPLLIIGIFMLQDFRARPIILMVLLLIGVGGCFIYSPLNNFTGGALLQRFQSTDTTGRIQIAQADLILFQNNLLLGVGPGQSFESHALTFRPANAHTEYTRMLAEHGLFGVTALLILLGAAAYLVLSKRTLLERMFALAFVAWALTFMAHSATRLAAPSLLFGLAFSRFKVDSLDDES